VGPGGKTLLLSQPHLPSGTRFGLWNLETGRPAWQTPPAAKEGEMTYARAFSRDGRRIAIEMGSTGFQPARRILLLHGDTGKTLAEIPSSRSPWALTPDGNLLAVGAVP